MATIVVPRPSESDHKGPGISHVAVAAVLAVWFVVIAALAASGTFVNSPGTPPLPIAVAVTAPLLLFAVSIWLSQAFRSYVLTLDLRLVAAIQAWRWAGFGFLSLYAHGILPAIFALPAGLGDMLVGFLAPWIVLRLARDPGFAASRAFVRWNLLGITDLVIAVGIGTVSALLTTGAPGEISTAPMATLPLILIPGFLVPVFLMLHVTALLQARRHPVA
jgi:hypothetical protein